MYYRLAVDSKRRIVLPEELIQELDIKPETELQGFVQDGVLTIGRIEEEIVPPERIELDMVETGLFWLPVEIAYYSEEVRVRCKDPKIEIWEKDREQGIQKFISRINEMLQL